MEVRGLHHSAMTRREAEIHPHIQDVANESCSAVLQEEVQINRSVLINKTYEPRHDKTNIVRLRPAWIQTSLRIRAV
jgi:hypothetical protein